MESEIKSVCQSHGYEVIVFSITELEKLEHLFIDLQGKGLIHPEIIKKYFGPFRYHAPDDLPTAQSIILIGGYSIPVKISFNYEGKTFAFLVPPTYASFPEDRSPWTILQKIHTDHGKKVVWARFPRKTMAVWSGLAVYGKNNLVYHPKWGSYVRWESFFSEIPGSFTTWNPSKIASECDKCNACQRACPTGAIHPNRIQISAEKCLTNFNEFIDPFPAWIQNTWHNSLVGCMKCQTVCPMNVKISKQIKDGGTLTEEDPAILLNHPDKDHLTSNMKQIFENVSLLDDIPLVSRNLKLLLDSQK